MNHPDRATFTSVGIDDAICAIRVSFSKRRPADPLSTWLVKECASTVAPFIARIFNLSLTVDDLLSPLKHYIVTSLLKKADLDESIVSSCRPMSNLPHLSKILERIVHLQVISHLEEFKLLPDFQSAYRRGHSSEMAVLKVYSDLFDAISNGKFTLLSLLDLSAAFDTDNHNILLHCLETAFSFRGVPLQLMRSYLDGRTQCILLRGKSSAPRPAVYGVLQDSVLGPLLFILYTADIGKLIQQYGLSHHSYADDNQLYSSCNQYECVVLKSRMIKCIELISEYMSSN